MSFYDATWFYDASFSGGATPSPTPRSQLATRVADVQLTLQGTVFDGRNPVCLMLVSYGHCSPMSLDASLVVVSHYHGRLATSQAATQCVGTGWPPCYWKRTVAVPTAPLSLEGCVSSGGHLTNTNTKMLIITDGDII